jgi:glutamine synthetase
VSSDNWEKDHLVHFAWSDLAGITRHRSVPSSKFEGAAESGLGWACAGHAITPLGGIAPNAWGPVDEVRQVPDKAAHLLLPADDHTPALDLYMCNSFSRENKPWDVCPRTFCEAALKDFEAETGLKIMFAFEHEFTLIKPDHEPELPYTLASTQTAAKVVQAILTGLQNAGCEPGTYEAEFGVSQYEFSCAPTVDIGGGDRCVFARETIREVARREGWRASFSPKPTPEAVGNGCHIHFSFRDKEGRVASFDDAQIGQLSDTAAHFVAGLHKHSAAMSFIAAPSPVSYLRLQPGHWSCGYSSFGIQNREASLRVCPPPPTVDLGIGAKMHNIEYRVVDGTANPYLVMGAMIHAGLDGIRSHLALPKPIDCDPNELSNEERAAHGVTRLPESLSAALQAFESDQKAMQWFPEALTNAIFSLKKCEIELAEECNDTELCELYGRAY